MLKDCSPASQSGQVVIFLLCNRKTQLAVRRFSGIHTPNRLDSCLTPRNSGHKVLREDAPITNSHSSRIQKMAVVRFCAASATLAVDPPGVAELR